MGFVDHDWALGLIVVLRLNVIVDPHLPRLAMVVATSIGSIFGMVYFGFVVFVAAPVIVTASVVVLLATIVDQGS